MKLKCIIIKNYLFINRNIYVNYFKIKKSIKIYVLKNK